MFQKQSFLFSLFLATALFAGEVQYAKGNFSMSAGLANLQQNYDVEITTYSLLQNHQNIFSSNYYYRYNISWYDSQTMVDTQNQVNRLLSDFSTPLVSSSYTPQMNYRMQGLDVNTVLGYDLYHKDENNYFGVGIMLGISLPWIDSKDENSDSSTDTDTTLLKETKTEIMTYKIGPTLSLATSYNKHFILYATATYAYQTGWITNSYVDSDFNVDGVFQEYDIGLKLQPLSEEYKMGWFTLSPRLYFTAGYRYTEWQLNDVDSKLLGQDLILPPIDFTMNTSLAYLGFGYSFF